MVCETFKQSRLVCLDCLILFDVFRLGIIHLIEKKMNAAVHWIICLLHMNELPLRALIELIDGKTSGPHAYKGEIGKKLNDCSKLPVCNFQKIFSDDLPVLPKDIHNDLSTDQKYLYDICHAIQSGKCSSSLSKKLPGKIVHSRFVTTANAILRYYMSQENPSENLKILAKYIVTIYAPVWFRIKWKSSVVHGPKHFFMLLKLIQENMPMNLHTRLISVLSRNAYFAHTENILLSMLVDENQSVRERAVNLIIEVRRHTKQTEPEQIRKFKKPNLVLNAQVYYEIVNLNDIQHVFEPPLLTGVPNEKLFECVEVEKNFVFIMIDGIPCHSQSVERIIRSVSIASKTVFGEENRQGKICTTIASREVLPRTETKKDYINFMKNK